MTFDEFLKDFVPTYNFYRKDAPFDGTMFETFGTEYEHVKNNPEYAWTIVDNEGEYYLLPGIRIVNRIGYFVTEKTTDFNIEEILID